MDMTGSTAMAGVPLGVLVVGSAAGAVLISRRSRYAGRQSGLILGYTVGTLGAAIVILAAVVGSFGLMLAGSAALGVANAAIFLSRYAAADVGRAAGSGRALGLVLAAAAVGAVASPNLLGPSGQLADWFGLPRLAGLYLIAVTAFPIAAALLATLPSPNTVGDVRQRGSAARAGIRDAIRIGRVRRALLVLAYANLVMVATMAVAPVHMTAHGHSLNSIGVVVGIHVLGMFAPSPLSGWLADRIGGMAVAAIGAIVLLGAGLGGAVVHAHAGMAFTAVLALVGLGWNAAVVGGSTELVTSAPPVVRSNAEGIGEVAMGLAAGASAPIAGLIVAWGGYVTLSLASAGMSALVVAILRTVPVSQRRTSNWRRQAGQPRGDRASHLDPKHRPAEPQTRCPVGYDDGRPRRAERTSGAKAAR
jgi:MFS family permease